VLLTISQALQRHRKPSHTAVLLGPFIQTSSHMQQCTRNVHSDDRRTYTTEHYHTITLFLSTRMAWPELYENVTSSSSKRWSVGLEVATNQTMTQQPIKVLIDRCQQKITLRICVSIGGLKHKCNKQ